MTDDHLTPGAGADAPPDPDRPPLTRSEHHRVVAGVCGGLGRHLDIDPVVFRVVVAVLCLSGGLGLFLYGLAWLIVPTEEPAGKGDGKGGRTELQRVLTGRVDGQSVGAVLLTVIGTGVFFSSMGDGDQLFPLLLLGGLVFLAVRHDPEQRRTHHLRDRLRGDGRRSGHRPGGPYDRLQPQPPVTGPHPEQPWEAVREQHARAREAGTVPQDTPHAGPSGYLWDPRHPERNPYAGPATAPPGAPAQPWWQRSDLPEGDPLRKADEPAARPARSTAQRQAGTYLGSLGLLLSAGAAATVWWAVDRHGSTALLSTVLAVVLLGLGLTLLVGAKAGRARWLVVPALLLTLALVGLGNSQATVKSAFGDRVWTATSASAVEDEYNLGAGNARLDLRGLDPAGATVASEARLGAGTLTVQVPANVEVRLQTRNGLGSTEITGIEGISDNTRHTYQLHPLNGQASKGTLDLRLLVGLGDIKVVQS
ncbi:PspC domain-containing protein [Kitasatospora sp. NPDC050543]|uniref:PspC domain-containing protein n=1 Tax=Kitasatospora sp. NPDC050543 TaxID=3364054 RepID=UPI003790F037